jgi:class 3 adenylate cyclase
VNELLERIKTFKSLEDLFGTFPQAAAQAKAVTGRFHVFVSAMSIRYKIAAVLVAVLCLAIASLGVVSFNQQKSTLRAEMGRRAAVLSQQLVATAKTAMLTEDDLAVYSAIKELQKAEGVEYAFVMDATGQVFAHSELALKGGKPVQPEDQAAMKAEAPLLQTVSYRGIPVLDAATPVTAKYGGKTLRVGTARVGLSQAELIASIRKQKLAFVGITSAFVALGLVISFALGKLLTRRIVVLMTGMKVVSQGNLNQLVRDESGDEIGALTHSFNDMILNLREKLHMEKYLSRSTLQLIKKLRDSDKLKLGGERRHVAVLFSDIRGFTAMTESLEAEAVVEMLNTFLNLQAEVIYDRGGVVDKFVGDEVMAIFTGDDAEYCAALAAQEIQNFARDLNAARERNGKRRISVGVGLNAGSVIMANMGSERQMDYTVIGDPINTAARLCGRAEAGQVVMSQDMAKSVGDRAKTRPLDPMTLKGKREPFQVVELLDVPGIARSRRRKTMEADAFCSPEGLNDKFTVRLREMSEGGCSFLGSQPFGVGARLSMRLPFPQLKLPEQVAAVVRHIEKEGAGFVVGVSFENLDQPAKDAVTEWVHEVVTEISAEQVIAEEGV